MTYLCNTWYLAAWDREVAPGQLFSRTLLDEQIVFYRDEAGVAHALRDRCPHRFAPLSMGRLCDGQIECPYHGLRFGADGRCRHNPHGDGHIPDTAVVPTYPLVERYTALWIWMGEAAAADADLIPDFASMDPARRVVGQGYLQVGANYLLEVDNILDLSHIQYLHGNNVGSEAVSRASTEIVQEGSVVHSNRLVRNEFLNEILERQYRLPPGQPVDRWLDTRWSPPATMELWVGVAPAGSDEPRRVGKRQPYLHVFTPATAKTTHYFFATSYPLRMGAEAVERAAADIEFLRRPFAEEDQPMLEAQQAAMGDADFWSLKPVLLPGDAPGVRARRVLDGLIAAEQAEQTEAEHPSLPITAQPIQVVRPPRADDATLDLVVVDRREEAEDICSFVLARPDGGDLPGHEAGAHVEVDLANGLVRHYSLCAEPGDASRWRIAVQREAASRGGSATIHQSLVKGSRIRLRGPRQHFGLEAAGPSLLIAGGIGVTPILAMAHALASQGRDFVFHYCTRSAGRTAFAAELAASSFADRVVIHHDDGPSDQRFDAATVLAGLDPSTHLYVCGPTGFMDHVLATARRLGLAEDRLHREYFAAASPDSKAARPFEIELAASGRIIHVPADKSALRALQDEGIEIAYSCEAGVCGSCLTPVLAGTPEHHDAFLTDAERAAGGCFTPCCSRALSERLVIDL